MHQIGWARHGGGTRFAMIERARVKPVSPKMLVGFIEIVLLLVVGMVLYADTVELPFFGDDPIDMRWIEQSSLADVWTSAAGVGYYRPLAFTVWWADRWLLGGFHPPLEHAVNLAFHILNAMLVVALARRLLGRRTPRWASLAAGLLFISFPFTYQAIPWVASLTHPLATFLILGSVLTAMRASGREHRSLRVASIVLAAAALFAHESSVVVGVLIALTVVLGSHRRPAKRELAWPLAYLALALAYVAMYFSIPRQTSPIPPLSTARITQTGAYLLQGLAYPVAPAARHLVERFGWSDLASAYLAAFVTAVSLLLLAWRSRRAREMCLVLLWVIVAIAPAALVLPFDYLLNGPRVLYLASVGATIAWATALAALASVGTGWVRVGARATAALVLGAILLFSARFVRERQEIHAMGGDLLWQATETLGGAPADERHFVVNFPAWLAPRRIVYPLGHEGVELMPSYASIGELVWSNGQVQRSIRTAKFSNALPISPGYYYGIRGPEVTWEELATRVRDADWVYLVHLEVEGPRLQLAGRVLDPARPPGPPLAIFDGRLALESAELSGADEGSAVMRLIWWSAGPMVDSDFRVFAHVYNDSGDIVAQADGYPLDGLYPFWIWRRGERVEDVRHLRLGELPDVDTARYGVGIYDPASGDRLPAYGPDGARLPNDAVLLTGAAAP